MSFGKLSLLSVGVTALMMSTMCVASNIGNYKGEWFAPQPFPPCLKDGFYIGVGGGYDSYKIRQDLTSTAIITGVTTLGLLQESPTLSAAGFRGEVFGGYGQYFLDRYYGGAEISATLTDAKNARTVTNFPALFSFVNTLLYKSKILLNQSFGISVLPGIKLDPSTLIYARVGYTRAKIKDEEDFTVLGIPFISASATKWTSGVTVGLGIERAVYQNLSVRGEYAYSRYDSFTNTFSTSQNPALGTVVTTSKLTTPANNSFTLDVLYHFA